MRSNDNSKGEAKVIPVLVRRVHWTDAPFSHIQLLPTEARPIHSWTNPDEAFYDVVVEVEKVIQSLLNLREAKEFFQQDVAPGQLKWYEEATIQAYDQAI